MKEYQKYNDYELLYMVAENDETAFSILYEKYCPLMQKYAKQYYEYYKQYGVDYDDLCQEAYLAFDRSLRYYKDKNETLFYTFLCITIRSRLLNYIKSFLAKKNCFFREALSLDQVYGDSDVVLGDFVSDPQAISLDDQLAQRWEMISVRKFCAELDFNDSQVFELYWNGFSKVEICTLLELPSTKISTIVRRVRKLLREYLSD